MDDWTQLLMRFAHYVLLLGLFGQTAFGSFGLRGVVTDRTVLASDAIVVLAAMAPLVSTALLLTSIAAMMGQPLWSLDQEVVETIVMTTGIGLAFVIRLALLVAALIALIMRPRFPAMLPVAAILYGGALMTMPWNGHAAATEGSIGLLHRLNDGVHLVAAGLWIGAIGWFAWLTARASASAHDTHALTAALHRFRPLGVALVGVVALTGTVNAQLVFGLGSGAAVLGTPYGKLLVIKVALVGIMLLCAARHASLARREWVGRGTRVHKSLLAEFVLATVVLGVVAGLGVQSPMSG